MDLFKKKTLKNGITIRELSIGLIYKIQSGIIKNDDIAEILKQCCDLSADKIENLGYSAANELYEEILHLTYGDLTASGEGGKKK